MTTINTSQGTTGNIGDINPSEVVSRPNKDGQTEAVSSALQSLGSLSWEERKYFMRRFSEVFGEENNMRSMAKDFDTAAYK